MARKKRTKKTETGMEKFVFPPIPKPVEYKGRFSREGRSLIVVLDAGHGGFDTGAVADYKGTRIMEKDLTRAIVSYITKHIADDPNIAWFLTRKGDEFVGLSARTKELDRIKADLFLSIHINAAPLDRKGEAQGMEAYIARMDDEVSYSIAEELLTALAEGTSLLLREEPIKANDNLRVLHNSIRVLDNSRQSYSRLRPLQRGNKRLGTPGVLLEIGFIDSEDLDYLLCEGNLELIGQIIAERLKDLAGRMKGV